MGRIFKISHETDKWVQVDLSKVSDKELVNYQLHQNEWYVRNARLILQERGPKKKVHKALRNILDTHPDVTRKLRALWALHVTKGLKEQDLLRLLDHENEYIRGWAIQLLAEDKNLSATALTRFVNLGKTDTSAMVRLYLASAMQRTAPENRWEIMEALLQRPEDKSDHNLPLMLWYAFEPTVPIDVNRAVDLAVKAKVPHILPFTIQRLGDIKSPESIKALEDLQRRVENTQDSHQNHEIQTLLKKALASN
jgi:hypothetical protein